MAVLVHDADFHSTRDNTVKPRWRSEAEESLWGYAQGLFARAVSSPDEEIDWLAYNHPEDGNDRSGGAAAVVDRYGYNQSLSRRFEEISDVDDLMLRMRLVKTSGEGLLWIRATSRQQEFLVQIDPNRGEWAVEKGGVTLGTGAAQSLDWSGQVEIEVSLIDGRFLLAIDRRQEFAWDFEPSADGHAGTSPLAIGAQGLGLKIRGVRVLRDVYYTHPIGLRGGRGIDGPAELGNDEYFVLGDNSPISEDSRTWPLEGGVSADLLMGKPLVVHFPARLVQVGSWEFQVPDLGKIRYIR